MDVNRGRILTPDKMKAEDNGETLVSSRDYAALQTLYEENKKSFREKLYRMRKGNRIVSEKYEELQVSYLKLKEVFEELLERYEDRGGFFSDDFRKKAGIED